jgi:hypothetical protein
MDDRMDGWMEGWMGGWILTIKYRNEFEGKELHQNCGQGSLLSCGKIIVTPTSAGDSKLLHF